MSRMLVRVLLSTMALLAVVSVGFAAEWKCNQVGGCLATNPQGQQVTMAKGDVVDTGSGWSVSRVNGWQPN